MHCALGQNSTDEVGTGEEQPTIRVLNLFFSKRIQVILNMLIIVIQ